MTHTRVRRLLWWGVYIIGLWVLINLLFNAMGW